MNKYFLFLINFIIFFNANCQQDPNVILGLIGWYNAGNVIQSNNLISEITDLSEIGYNLIQENSAKKPSLVSNGLGNLPTIRFNGSSNSIQSIFGTILAEQSTIFVINNSENLNNYIFDGGTTRFAFRNANNLVNAFTVNSIGYPKNSIYDYSLFTFFFDESNSKIFENSVLKKTGNLFPGTLNGLTLGSNKTQNGYFLKGNISEIIIYNRILSETEQADIEIYLMNKYAPQINLGSDLSIDYGFCDISLSSPNYYPSYLWSTGSTDSLVTVSEPGVYWLETIDIFGRSSRDSIIISRPPFNEVELQNQLVCFNEPDTISANLPQGNYTFVQWSDGNTNPVRILNQNESISYTVSDSLGCTGSSNTAIVSIDNSLESISLGVDTSLCSGNLIQLIQSSMNITNWLWNTQDTLSTLSIDTSGVYILDILNDNGCQNSDTIEVTIIGDAPDLSYSIPFEICQGSELNFNENSNVPPGNTISQVVWDFGDLDSSFNSDGSHIYIDSGSFNASLQVSTLEGCSSQDEFTITVYPKPIISFTTENYCPYEEISFSASNSYDVPLASYLWGFGQNDNTSLDSNPSYSYGLSGNYEVELISVDTNNCIDTVVQNVYVQPAPLADIVIQNACELSSLQIIDNSTIEDTFSIVSYNWNYGDGTDSVNPVQGKYYESYGEYTVQLVLTGNNGCVDTTEQNITVHPNPIINYQVGPACKNTWTKFDDLSTIPQGSITATDWLFNLQFEDNTTNTYFNFPTTGIQLIDLTSTSDQGCIVDTTFTVDVNEELNANFNVNPEILVSDVPISFTNTSVGSDSSYWDFGNADGLNYNNDIENSITYSNLLNGTYVDITLITINDFGCRDTISKTLLVNEALYDINLETLFAQDINGYITVGVEIANLGTIPLESLNLTLKTPENGPIQENWSGSILQGENEIYIFNAQPSAFISDQDATERFVCVEAQNANISTYLDINQDNNTKCKNIEGSGFVLVSVYPNPTDEDITISILLSETSSIYVELYDQTGRMVYNKLNEEMEPGIHDFNMPFSTFESGIYSLRVFDGNLTRVEKIIKR